MIQDVCGIYSITNLTNSKRLIGQSMRINKRWSAHRKALLKNSHWNPHLQNSWNRDGQLNFKFEILHICQIEDLDNEEVKFIALYKTMDRQFGYNLISGGNRPTYSDEVKKKISIAQTGKIASEATKQKMSEAHSGPNHHYYGKHRSQKIKDAISKKLLGSKLSEETKRKISLKNKGKMISEETKAKIKANHKGFDGFNHTEETKMKMSQSQTGIKNHRFGKPLSEETKRKISETRKRTNLLKQIAYSSSSSAS